MSEPGDLREGFHETDLGWNEREDILYKDPVTGGLNRTAYELFMPRLLDEARSKKIPLSLAVFDLDGFKELNDTKGHVWGDEKLKELSQNIESSIRRTDYIFHYGGDEFVLAFRDLNLVDTEKILVPKIRKTLEEAGMTGSLGLSEMRSGDDLKSIFNRADQLMYKEKKSKK